MSLEEIAGMAHKTYSTSKHADATNEVSSGELRAFLKQTLENREMFDMMQKLGNTNGESNQSSLAALKEFGIDLDKITGVHQQAANTYRGVADLEQQRRKEVEEKETQVREQNYEYREKMIDLMMQQQMERQNQMFEKMMDKFDKNNDKNNNNNPVNDMAMQTLTKLLEDKINEVQQPPPNPMEQVFASMDMYENLFEKFREKIGIPDSGKKEDLEMYKLRVEDERLRAIEERRMRLEEQKQETMKHTIDTLGAEIADGIGALAAAFKNFGQQEQQTQEPVQQQQSEQPSIIPFQCEECNHQWYYPADQLPKEEDIECPVCVKERLKKEQQEDQEMSVIEGGLEGDAKHG